MIFLGLKMSRMWLCNKIYVKCQSIKAPILSVLSPKNRYFKLSGAKVTGIGKLHFLVDFMGTRMNSNVAKYLDIYFNEHLCNI